MKKPIILFVFVAVIAIAAPPKKEFRLWEGPAPGAKGEASRDIPTLTPFWPGTPSGAAMVILPGGGYGGLASHEGPAYAQWLKSHGVACFVLKYRLGSAGYRHPVMLHDVARAIRTVRANAKAWEIDPERIGVMGSSAGGHLASTIVAHFDGGNSKAKDPIDRVSSRPDIGVLCYPVISMGKHTHGGSRANLLGREPTADLIKLLSNELQVKSNSPPCFIFHTWEDRVVKVENALMFAAALRAQGVIVDLHIYEKGRHGIGLGAREPARMHPWTSNLVFWLKERKFVK
tara:strand:+ start:5261 stop:6124 length:864 start_codon:yes stop_codon:yes gene_type:complete